ncbi:unnamed protein product [Diplocarpon coronariae]
MSSLPFTHRSPLTRPWLLSKGAPPVVESDYPIKFDAVFVHGSDVSPQIRQDPVSGHNRLDFNSILNRESGAVISYQYRRTIRVAPEIVTHVLFETGSEESRSLEQMVYIAGGRFVLEPGKPVVFEYKISEISALI